MLNILARYRDPPSESPLDVVVDLKLNRNRCFQAT
jgi:hypothetical protein